MTATGQNFEMYQGDTKNLHVTTYDGQGNLQPITGGTLVWVLYEKPHNNIVLTKETTTSGIIMTSPDVGEFDINLIPIDTIDLMGIYYHECELTDSSGDVSTIMVGVTKIYQSQV